MSDNNKRLSIFVIGGSGTIGGDLISLLAPEASAGKLRLRAGVRSDASAAKVRGLGAEAVQFDLNDRLTRPTLHVEALRGSDVVFLLTGYSVDMLAESKAVVDSAIEAGVDHIVHLGLMALPDTRGIHQGWHQMIEAYIERSGLGWTHLHPNMFTSAFYAMQLQNSVFPVPESGPVTLRGYIEPQVRCSWISTTDIARAAAAVLREPARHHGKAYKLAVEAMTFPELARLASEILGREFQYQSISPEGMLERLRHAPIDQKYGESGYHTMRMVNEGLLPDFGDVHEDFQAVTGELPVTWREEILRHKEWFGLQQPSRHAPQ